jgi:hypothetical protein
LSLEQLPQAVQPRIGLFPTWKISVSIFSFSSSLAISHKGDAVYETSSSGTEAAAWNTDHSTMPRLDMPWFVRGGHYWSDINAGSFFFYIHSGVMGGGVGFRPVLAVSMEL